ncbi:glycosyltransferase family 4 protein [Deferrisoma sp.]
MKIAHVCLSNFFVDERAYQENELVRHHVAAGHDVLVLASTETHDENGRLVYCKPMTYVSKEGATLVRIPYSRWLPHSVIRKLRIHPGVYKRLAEFAPQSILFHGAASYELVTVARYVRDHPGTLLFIDNHAYWANSGRNFISRNLLHRWFYRLCLQKALPYTVKVLCVSTEAVDFANKIYRVPMDKLELFPLGGRPLPPAEYKERRIRKRLELQIDDDTLLFVQSGKLTRRKKLIESLKSFAAVGYRKARFAIAGVLGDDIRVDAERLISEDPRVIFLGWQSVEDLTDLLCAADVYIQPGTQSVTMQHALCCHCPVAIADVPAHRFYSQVTGWLLNEETTLETVFKEASVVNLDALRDRAYGFSVNMLDYKVLSQRVLHP